MNKKTAADKRTATVCLHYLHPQSGRQVRIQGMVHVAPAEFFNAVNANIKQFLQDCPDNGRVLLEKVSPETADKQAAAALKAQLNAVLARLTKVEDFTLERAYRLVAEITGCENQLDDRYLDGVPSEKTQIADMSSEQMLDFLLKQQAIADLMAQEPFKYKYRMAFLEKCGRLPVLKSIAAWVLKRGLRAVLRQNDPDAETAADNGDWEAQELAFMEVVQKERNRVLMEKLGSNLDSGRDVFITYGAAHFSPKQKRQFDVLAFLEERGFVRTKRQDMPVF